MSLSIYLTISQRRLKDVCGILGFYGVLAENTALLTVNLFAR